MFDMVLDRPLRCIGTLYDNVKGTLMQIGKLVL